MVNRRKFITGVVAAGSISVAGCSSDEGDSTESTETEESSDERSWVEDCWSALSSSWKSQRARVTRSCHPTNDVSNQDVCIGASSREPATTGSLA